MQDIALLGLELNAWLDRVVQHADKDRLILEFFVDEYFNFKVAGQIIFFSGNFRLTESFIFRIGNVLELNDERGFRGECQVRCCWLE